MKQLEILTSGEVQKIHDYSLNILEKHGVYFWGDNSALDIFRARGCRTDGSKVYIPSSLVEECLRTLPKREGLSYFNDVWYRNRISLKRGCTHLSLIGNAYYTADYGANEARVATNEDFENKDSVYNALDSFETNYCIVFPLPGHESTTKPFFDDLSNADKAIEFLGSRLVRKGLQCKSKGKQWAPHLICRPIGFGRLEQLSFAIIEGSKALEDRLADSQPCHVWVNPVSPLQYNGDQTTDVINTINFPGKPVFISSECMMGMTSPITLAGTMVQQNAEILGMTVLAQLANPGCLCVYGCVSCATDLRNAEISHGNFETQAINVASVQMADFYGMPSRIAPGNTSALQTGPRAAAETALGLYMGMAAGANIITIGLLNSTLTLSLEHMVLIDELFKQYKKTCRGFEFNDDTVALDVIHEEGHPSPNFISHEHTLEHMNTDLHFSSWNGRSDSSYEDWYEHAHRKVNDILQTAYKPDTDALERYTLVSSRLKEDMSHIQKGNDGWWRFYCQDFN